MTIQKQLKDEYERAELKLGLNGGINSPYFNFLYVNLGYIALIAAMMYYRSIIEIRQNWAQYRCIPPYWVFSTNVAEDFTYCVQDAQKNMMGYLLEPLNYMVSSLTSIGTELSGSINSIRVQISSVRNFLSSIIETVFGVFFNSVVAFQAITVSIKDMVGKLIGTIVTIMYVLDGAIKSMESTWEGPPGQMVKAIGSCFHPDTKVRLKNGAIYSMKDLPLGAELEDGAKIFSVMKIHNINNDILYKVPGGIDEEDIYVTGNHFIYDKETDEWKQVKFCKQAIPQYEVESDWFSCLITTNRQIQIGSQFFWDWEDDELLGKI